MMAWVWEVRDVSLRTLFITLPAASRGGRGSVVMYR